MNKTEPKELDLSKYEGHTPGPWIAYNMVNEDGSPMTPDQIGEYVCNAVKVGEQGRFLFISGTHEDGAPADICHVGNGPRGPVNSLLIQDAPRLLAEVQSLRAQRDELVAALEPFTRMTIKVPGDDAMHGGLFHESCDICAKINIAREALNRIKGEKP